MTETLDFSSESFSNIKSKTDVGFLYLFGSLDVSTVKALEPQLDHLSASWCDSIVIDASALTTIDDAGIKMLSGIQHYIEFRGGKLIICGARTEIAEQLDAAEISQ